MKQIVLTLALCLATTAQAGSPKITKVTAVQSGGDWRFDVTVEHDDTGWDHYANAWRVLDMQGNLLGVRDLAHPHENEQPFTRSLSGVVIPQGINQVQIQTSAIPHGWSSDMKVVDLK